MIDLVASFVVGRSDITKDEAEEWAQEFRNLGETGEYFFGMKRYFFLASFRQMKTLAFNYCLEESWEESKNRHKSVTL